MHCSSSVRSSLLPIVLHLLEQMVIFVSQGLVLPPNCLEFLASVLQLNLCLTTHLAATLEVSDMIRSYMNISNKAHPRIGTFQNIPLDNISHLLDLLPWLAGIWARNDSNSDFISVRRFRSAILWLFRRAGVRLYGEVASGESASLASELTCLCWREW